VQIIEESKQPQYMMLERFRSSLAEVCKHVLARYRQFFPEGLEFYQMQEDPEGMQMVAQFFQWPKEAIEKDVIIETKVSSASMSKSLRKQEMVALLDKLNQYYQQLMGLAQAATDPMNPTAMIAAYLMNGLYTIMNDMLIEFEVGKKDALNPQLMEVTQVAQQIQAQMQQLMQQVNQLGAQNQQLQAANAQLQAVVGGQQPGMVGPPGPQPGIQGPMPGPAPPQGQGNGQVA
jgi:prefoldin subunit 5